MDENEDGQHRDERALFGPIEQVSVTVRWDLTVTNFDAFMAHAKTVGKETNHPFVEEGTFGSAFAMLLDRIHPDWADAPGLRMTTAKLVVVVPDEPIDSGWTEVEEWVGDSTRIGPEVQVAMQPPIGRIAYNSIFG